MNVKCMLIGGALVFGAFWLYKTGKLARFGIGG